MIIKKVRLTVTIDPPLVRAATEAVRSGRAESVSAWVGAAIEERVVKEQQLRAMAGAISAYETEFGAITLDELIAQERADREKARVVRGRGTAGRPRRRRRHGNLA